MAKKVKPNKEIAFNPIEGKFDLVSGNNFSYESVPLAKKLRVRENEQMIIKEEFILEGTLELDGALFLEE